MFLKNGVTSHVFQKIGVTLNAAAKSKGHMSIFESPSGSEGVLKLESTDKVFSGSREPSAFFCELPQGAQLPCVLGRVSVAGTQSFNEGTLDSTRVEPAY